MKRSKLFLFFSLICNSGIGQSLYDSAVRTYYRGELNPAIDLFSKCINSNEKPALSYMYRGAAKSFLGRSGEAFEDLDISLKTDSTNDKILYYYGKAFLLNKEYGMAAMYFKKSIERKKDDPARYDALASAQAFLGNAELVIKYENRAIELDSTDATYYINRGYAKMKLHDPKSSIIDFSKAIALGTMDFKAYFDRGTAYYNLAMDNNALADFNIAISMNPGSAEILYLRGLTFKELKKQKEACADLKKSAEMGYADAIKITSTYCK